MLLIIAVFQLKLCVIPVAALLEEGAKDVRKKKAGARRGSIVGEKEKHIYNLHKISDNISFVTPKNSNFCFLRNGLM